MRIEPENLDRAALAELLRDRYLLELAQLEFVPYGIDSWSYVATATDGSRAFVNLKRLELAGGAPAWELPLLAALADAGLPVARPMADRDGGFPNALGRYSVHVLEYLDGRTLEDESAWPDGLYARVAETVAAVHAGTAAVRDFVGRSEDYELPFLPSLTATLTAIDTGGPLPAADEASARLREMVGPRTVELRAAVVRLESLRDSARIRVSDAVLCHTDIWGSNPLLPDDGTPHLLDWDGALIGPPERDLFMFAGTTFFPPDRLAWFLDRYEAAFRRVRLEADAFGFYLYRRNLEDLAGFADSLAAGRNDAMAPGATLGIVAELLDELPRIEGYVDRIREVLAARD